MENRKTKGRERKKKEREKKERAGPQLIFLATPLLLVIAQ